MNTEKRVAVLACDVFRLELEQILDNMNVYYVEMGLHTDHKDLRERIEEELKRLKEEYDAIVLAFGECHPQMKEIADRYGAVNLDAQNCIEALIGRRELERLTGYFYLSPGWIMGWRNVVERMGWTREDARLNYGPFKAALYLDTVGDADKRMDDFLEFFDYTMLPIETKKTSLKNLERLIRTAIEQATRGGK